MVSRLLFRREPRLGPRDRAFLGWFGTRGLASIVFAVPLIETEAEVPHESVLLTTAFVTLGHSVLAQRRTARRPLRLLPHPAADTLHVESGETTDIRWRGPPRVP